MGLGVQIKKSTEFWIRQVKRCLPCGCKVQTPSAQCQGCTLCGYFACMQSSAAGCPGVFKGIVSRVPAESVAHLKGTPTDSLRGQQGHHRVLGASSRSSEGGPGGLGTGGPHGSGPGGGQGCSARGSILGPACVRQLLTLRTVCH
jgi:hypothetical protein